jgi:aspartyl-tRNA synthetase
MNIKESVTHKGDVTIRGWVKELRDLKKIKFIVLRDGSGELQVLLKDESTKLKKIFEELTKESYIEVTGSLVESKQAKLGKELVPSDIKIISKSEQPLPIDISGKIETSLDKRLDWRFLDLRRREISSIFKIEAEVCRLFREFFGQKGFVEVWTPSIIAAASEGGTELFKVDYLGKKAYLAQSPQLYKQLLTMCNLEKVFLITPIWRAEPHNTTKHLNEIRQMDIEMANADDETVMKLLKEVVEHIIKGVKENCSEELSALNRELKMPKTIMLTYHEAIEKLQKAGLAIKDGDDISSEAEKKLAELYDPENMIFLSKWPTKLKPFYIMPEEKNPKLSRGFDMDMGGIELSSGGQRIHIPELLTKRIKECGLNPKDFEFYINSFKYGAPPHAGWSVGLERITTVICGLNNVREACLFPRDSVRLTP